MSRLPPSLLKVKAFNMEATASIGLPLNDNTITHVALTKNATVFNEQTLHEGVEFLFLMDDFQFILEKNLCPSSLKYIEIFGKIKYPLEEGSIPFSRMKNVEVKLVKYNHIITKDVFPLRSSGGISKLWLRDLDYPLPIDVESRPKIFTHLYIAESKHPITKGSIITGKNIHIGDLEHAFTGDNISTSTTDIWVHSVYKHKITAESIPSHISRLHFNGYSLNYTIPPTVKGIAFNQVHFVNGINNEIPNHITDVKIRDCVGDPVILPNSITQLFLRNYHFELHRDWFPLSLDYLLIDQLCYPLNENSFPTSLGLLHFYDGFNQYPFKKSILPITPYPDNFKKYLTIE